MKKSTFRTFLIWTVGLLSGAAAVAFSKFWISCLIGIFGILFALIIEGVWERKKSDAETIDIGDISLQEAITIITLIKMGHDAKKVTAPYLKAKNNENPFEEFGEGGPE